MSALPKSDVKVPPLEVLADRAAETVLHQVRSNYVGLTGPPWAYSPNNPAPPPQPSLYDQQLAAVLGQHGDRLGRSDACADYVAATLAYAPKE